MTPTLTLHDGGQIPQIGLGTWKIAKESAYDVVREALRLGYRHLDCACDYGNEDAVGAGLASALAEGVCGRDDVWVTSKLWNTYHHPQHVRAAAERSLRDLRLEVLDLYLVHFPISLEFVPFEHRYPPGWVYDPLSEQPQMQPSDVPLADTWGALEELVHAGLVKRIGVCNFGTALLRELLKVAAIRPAVLQVEMHPYLAQRQLLRFCQEERIACTAFSPLGAPSYVPLQMADAEESVLENPAIRDIAEGSKRTPAQVVLRWGLQRGTVVIPKTSRADRLDENLQAADFELSEMHMQQIDALDRNRRFNDPGVFCEAAFGRFFPIFD